MCIIYNGQYRKIAISRARGWIEEEVEEQVQENELEDVASEKETVDKPVEPNEIRIKRQSEIEKRQSEIKNWKSEIGNQKSENGNRKKKQLTNLLNLMKEDQSVTLKLYSNSLKMIWNKMEK